MDATQLVTLVEQLDDGIDDLEEALRPLITAAISETAQKLPLLDRAKLYALATYAIESVLFSFIRLNGANAKDHPVFRELTRVKQYFGKIKDVEIGHQKRVNLTLDKHAAGRVIKHALAGNVRFDHVQAQQRVSTMGSPQPAVTSTAQKRKLEEIEDVDARFAAPPGITSELINRESPKLEMSTTKPRNRPAPATSMIDQTNSNSQWSRNRGKQKPKKRQKMKKAVT